MTDTLNVDRNETVNEYPIKGANYRAEAENFRRYIEQKHGVLCFLKIVHLGLNKYRFEVSKNRDVLGVLDYDAE